MSVSGSIGVDDERERHTRTDRQTQIGEKQKREIDGHGEYMLYREDLFHPLIHASLHNRQKGIKDVGYVGRSI